MNPVVAKIVLLSMIHYSTVAATLPFTENFNSYDNASDPEVSPTGFIELIGAAAWTVEDDGVGNDYQFARAEVNNTSSTLNTSFFYSYVSVSDLGTRDFVMSCQMTIDAAMISGDSRNAVTAGLTCLGSGVSTRGYFGAVDLINGTLTLFENGTVRATDAFPVSLMAATDYVLQIKGTYNGPSSLTLDFSMSDGTHTGSVSFVDSSPQAGQRFGFETTVKTYPGGTSASMDVDYDDLMIMSISPPVMPVLSIVADGGQTTISMEDLEVGINYSLENSTNLVNWVGTTNISASATTTNYTEEIMIPWRFYRLRVED